MSCSLEINYFDFANEYIVGDLKFTCSIFVDLRLDKIYEKLGVKIPEKTMISHLPWYYDAKEHKLVYMPNVPCSWALRRVLADILKNLLFSQDVEKELVDVVYNKLVSRGIIVNKSEMYVVASGIDEEYIVSKVRFTVRCFGVKVPFKSYFSEETIEKLRELRMFLERKKKKVCTDRVEVVLPDALRVEGEVIRVPKKLKPVVEKLYRACREQLCCFEKTNSEIPILDIENDLKHLVSKRYEEILDKLVVEVVWPR